MDGKRDSFSGNSAYQRVVRFCSEKDKLIEQMFGKQFCHEYDCIIFLGNISLVAVYDKTVRFRFFFIKY